MLYLIPLLILLSVIAINPQLNRIVSSRMLQDGKVLSYMNIQKSFPIQDKKRPMYIFFHICTQGKDWKHILDTQMQSIITSGLYEKCHTLWYGCSCYKCVDILKEYFAAYKKVKPLPRAMCAKEKTYENQTLNSMIRFCKELPDTADCLYIHTKGTTAKSKAQHAWRDYMMYWMVERHDVALDLLHRGFHTVGPLYQKLPFKIYGYYRLYLGNFFWVSSEHMKQLPIINNVSNRFLAEQLIFLRYTHGKHACINPQTFASVYIPFKTGLYKDSIDTIPVTNEDLQIRIV